MTRETPRERQDTTNGVLEPSQNGTMHVRNCGVPQVAAASAVGRPVLDEAPKGSQSGPPKPSASRYSGMAEARQKRRAVEVAMIRNTMRLPPPIHADQIRWIVSPENMKIVCRLARNAAVSPSPLFGNLSSQTWRMSSAVAVFLRVEISEAATMGYAKTAKKSSSQRTNRRAYRMSWL